LLDLPGVHCPGTNTTAQGRALLCDTVFHTTRGFRSLPKIRSRKPVVGTNRCAGASRGRLDNRAVWCGPDRRDPRSKSFLSSFPSLSPSSPPVVDGQQQAGQGRISTTTAPSGVALREKPSFHGQRSETRKRRSTPMMIVSTVGKGPSVCCIFGYLGASWLTSPYHCIQSR
jgi:hypothetical protein